LALGGEAGFERDPASEHGTAVHLAGDTLAGQLLEVAADRHVRNSQQVGEVGHPDRAVTAQFGQDSFLALMREHSGSLGGCHRFPQIPT
jgi:hypothetical protein